MLLKLSKEQLIKYAFLVTASSSILIVLLIFAFLAREAFPFLEKPGLGELIKCDWIPVSFQQETFGIVPLICGSLLVTTIATILMVPFGIGASVYIAELAYPKEREFLKPFIEILAGIPSVVIGFFGLLILVPAMKKFFGLSSGLTAMSGGILLAIMAVPTVVSISEDAIRSVPQSYKAASLALGASKIQTVWKVIVPAALPGIITAIMLGIGRVVGETMAVLMVTGNARNITGNPLESVRTMTATIANEMGEVEFGSTHYSALFCVGIVLLITTFMLNVVAHKVLKKYGIGQIQ